LAQPHEQKSTEAPPTWGFISLYNETVVRQIDDGYARGRGSVRRSATYSRAATGRLVRNEVSIEHFLSAISYHTPAPLRL
ncbi:hypothetical protein T11_6816, partial [Trichinella zimbabwensis]